MLSVYWLLGAAALCILEMITISLTCIWFAGGALIASIAAYFGLPLILQLIIFAVISVILLILTRPIAIRYVNRKTRKTNVDRLVGKHQIVTQTIDPSKNQGIIQIGDVEWGAKPEDGKSIIEAGTEIEIVEISGVKLIVKPVEEEDDFEEEVEEVISEDMEEVKDEISDTPETDISGLIQDALSHKKDVEED